MITIKAARRAGVPLVVVETADAAQSILTLVGEMNGKVNEVGVLRWDVVHGLTSMNGRVGDGVIKEIVKTSSKEEIRNATIDPAQCLALLEDAPEKALVFFVNLHLFWRNESVLQATWNLRDAFKTRGVTLVTLVPFGSAVLPDELKQDCIILTDTLPTEEEISKIVEVLLKDAGLDAKKIKDVAKIHDTLLGLSAFSAEQVLAMSITKDGIDRDGLWERKRKMIEQTPGLSVWRGGETFDDVGGCDNIKTFMRSVVRGNGAPRAVVFIDEIEKSMAASQTDTSGVSQDYLRTLLTEMQDKKASGIIFIGPPGCSKSMVAKATGNDTGIPTVALDLGGMKGSLVGESERRLRSALHVIDAVSQGKTLYIATCNSIGILPPELKRRFKLGTFFFALPTEAERKDIWAKKLKQFGLKDGQRPKDNGWTGAEIENCVEVAWRLKISLEEAARFIVPVSVSSEDRIDKLCREAHEKYVSASLPGLYRYEKLVAKQATGRRIGD